MTLYGKGYYMWQIPRCDGGNPLAIVGRATAAGLSHVLIKILDGTFVYNLDKETKTDLLPPVIRALREAGVKVWGWHYVMGDNPVKEAHLAVDRVRALGLDGYAIDAEGEFKKSGKEKAAKRFMHELRAGLASFPIALSTYRFPRLHQDFPFEEFLEGCDYAMPQVYFEGAHNPGQQLERCVEQYMALRSARPVIPTAPTYATSKWRPTPEEIQHLLRRAKEMGLTAANAWSWDFATRPGYIDLWNAVAGFDWPPEAPLADMPERLIGRMNQRDAALVAGLYRDNAAHVTGMRTVVGRAAIQQWYEDLFTNLLPNAQFEMTGKSGSGYSRHFTWNARSSSGVVLDGNDTLGIRDGRVQFHYTYFTIT